jgi:hypothetical protein
MPSRQAAGRVLTLRRPEISRLGGGSLPFVGLNLPLGPLERYAAGKFFPTKTKNLLRNLLR